MGHGDQANTTAYFDEHCPEYSPQRLDVAAAWLRERLGPGVSLLDVGCGTGNVLEHVAAAAGITDIAGMDPSERVLAQARARLGCPTYAASILDPRLAERVGRRFDVVLLAAVLHHLVGRTRRASRELARRALANALDVTTPGGYVVVVEPVFEPGWPMTAVFYVKRGVSAVTTRRVTLGSTWNNIGAPVVSYFTTAQLAALPAGLSAEPVMLDSVDRGFEPLLRFAGVRRRTETTMVLHRRESQDLSA